MGRAESDQHPLIMVVDDDWLNRDLMESTLTLNDYRVILANNGQKALQLAASHSPALVLLDVRMPDMSGYEVCAKIKADKSTQDTRIIMVSGLQDSRQEREMALKSGADDFVTRTIPVENLLERIAAALTNPPVADV
jgi:two-component system, cell cycle response regulator